jgi:hypothetical protein
MSVPYVVTSQTVACPAGTRNGGQALLQMNMSDGSKRYYLYLDKTNWSTMDDACAHFFRGWRRRYDA